MVKKRIPVKFKSLVDLTPGALNALLGTEIDRVDVLVDEIRAGSLLERVILRFLFRDEEGMNQFIDKVRAYMGDNTSSVLTAAVILALFYYGAQLVNSAQNEPTVHIEANNNTIIQIGASELDISPEHFKTIVHAAVPDKKELAKAAQQMLKPARSDPGASLGLDDDPRLTVPPEVILETTETRYREPPDEYIERVSDAMLSIRQTNRDSSLSGWAARLPGRFEQKIKLQLAEGVDPEEIAGLAQIAGDIEIHFKRVDKKYEPAKIVLLHMTGP